VPKIMAAVMSWHDAKPLLEQMDGPEAPAGVAGRPAITYRLGGGRVKVHLKVDMDNSVKPNYVVEARLRGAGLPDEWVLVGNHRDAWEFGGVDPSSGTASMLEMTRALGEMARRGIRPRRTIIACSWDGEEVGLTGSTEWGEQFAADLARRLVAYLNVDASASGPNFQGVPSGRWRRCWWRSAARSAIRREPRSTRRGRSRPPPTPRASPPRRRRTQGGCRRRLAGGHAHRQRIDTPYS